LLPEQVGLKAGEDRFIEANSTKPIPWAEEAAEKLIYRPPRPEKHPLSG